MVLCGGLEFVAAGVVYHEYQKHKKEKQRIEEERDQAIERQRRHRHRRHSASSEKPRPRPSRQEDYKYGYKPQHSSKPGLYDPGSRPAALAGLYGATVPSSQYGSAVYGKPGASASMLALPTPPLRPTSAPTTDHTYHGQPPRQNSNSPPTYMMTQNPTYNSGLGPISHPQSQQPPASFSPSLPPAGMDPRMHYTSPTPSGPYLYQDTKHHFNPSLDPRRTSDTSLPLGIYEPSHASESRDSVHELGGGEYWMRDDYRYRHPTGGRYSQDPQHVRFRLPNDRVVGSGDRASVVETPPPAYRA